MLSKTWESKILKENFGRKVPLLTGCQKVGYESPPTIHCLGRVPSATSLTLSMPVDMTPPSGNESKEALSQIDLVPPATTTLHLTSMVCLETVRSDDRGTHCPRFNCSDHSEEELREMFQRFHSPPAMIDETMSEQSQLLYSGRFTFAFLGCLKSHCLEYFRAKRSAYRLEFERVCSSIKNWFSFSI